MLEEERHPWLYTYTIMSIIIGIFFCGYTILGIFTAIYSRPSIVDLVIALFGALFYAAIAVWFISYGLKLLRETNKFKSWSPWWRQKNFGKIVTIIFWYPGFCLTLFFLLIPFVIIKAIFYRD